MLSLVVALPLVPVGEEFSFVLSRNAVAGLAPTEVGTVHDALPTHGNAPLSQLPRADEVVVVVPSRRLSWHQVRLPKVNSARLRNALEELLEGRLLDEPHALHLALSPDASPGQAVWIAACDGMWLRSCLHVFELAGLRIARVVPEHAPLSSGSAAVLHATGTPESAWLIRCSRDGVQTMPLSSLLLATMEWKNTPRETGRVIAEPPVAAQAEKVLGAPIEIEHSVHRLVTAARSEWNLAQFDLASSESPRIATRIARQFTVFTTSPAWRRARWGLTILILSNLIALNAWI